MAEAEATNEYSGKADSDKNFDRYYMGLACIASLRSKDPDTQVGACIVNKHGHPIGLGWNGMPLGVPDQYWKKNQRDPKENKTHYVCHAEMNAIHFCNRKYDLAGSTIYTTLHPCNQCASLIIQSGIEKVVYLEGPHMQSREEKKVKNTYKASVEILDKINLEYSGGDIKVEIKLEGNRVQSQGIISSLKSVGHWVIDSLGHWVTGQYRSDPVPIKRQIYMDKIDFYMYVAKWAAMQSEDPRTKVGAVVVGPNTSVYGIGWNSLAKNVENTTTKWERCEKYNWVVFAEVNAIINSALNTMEGCSLYTTHFPAPESTKHIVQSGIKEVFFLEYHKSKKQEGVKREDVHEISRSVFRMAGVRVNQYVPPNSEKIKFIEEEESQEQGVQKVAKIYK